ncbi:MAG: CHAT domain-containing protein [Anaerolineae bacterium]|nr:CHAT domain-containing protein [Anaerolineae bacterium]
MKTWIILWGTLTLLLGSPLSGYAAPLQQTPPILFQDNFSNPKSGWEVGNWEGGRAAYVAGQYVITAEAGAVSGAPPQAFANVTIEVDMTPQLAATGDYNAYGVICHYQDKNNYYVLMLKGNGSYGIIKMLRDEPVLLAVNSATDVLQTTPQQPRRVKGVCGEGYLALYVDGVLIAAAQDDEFKAGQVMLMAAAYQKDQPMQVGFDNVVITALQESEESRVIDKAQADRYLDTCNLRFAQGDYQAALTACEKARALYQQSGAQVMEATTLNNIGAIYLQLADYQQAIAMEEQALTLAQTTGAQALEATTLSNIADVYRAWGQFDTANQYYTRAASLLEITGDQALLARVLNNRGALYYLQSSYELALADFENALRLGAAAQLQPTELVGILINIGNVYYALNQYADALQYYRQALAQAAAPADPALEATLYNNMGEIFRATGDTEQALLYYERARAAYDKTGNAAGQALVEHNLGALYYERGAYADAEKAFQTARQLFVNLGNQPLAAAALNNLGMTYTAQSQDMQARDAYEEALTLFRAQENTAGQVAVLGNLALAYETWGQNDQALTAILTAIDLIEVTRADFHVESLLTALESSVAVYYRDAIHLLLRAGRLTDAFHYVQRAKARTFLNQMGNLRINPRATDVPALLEKEQTQLEEIHTLEAELSAADLSDDRRQAIQTRLAAAYSAHDRLLTQIKLSNPEYAALRSVQAGALTTVQQTLPANTTLVEYYVMPSLTLAFVVTPEAFHAIPLAVAEETLYTLIRDFREPARLEAVPQASRDLYTALFAPLRDYIQTGALLIAPHGPLHYIPWGALHDGQRFLVESYVIGYIPSASVLSYLPAHESAAGAPALVFGTSAALKPLPGVEEEAQAIAALLGTTARTGAEATEIRFWQDAPGARYIHLAAHAEFNAHAPQFSRIYLTKDADKDADKDAHKDGYLEVQEIWNLRLAQADLVTLSACETQVPAFKGLSDEMAVTAGDELVGLSRAFFYAGAPSLVVSLWTVEDQPTRFFMEHFYGHLTTGAGKAAALRQAQLDTMQVYPHPLDWAAFTLHGDMGAVETVVPPTPAAVVTATPEMALPATPTPAGGSGTCGSALLPLVAGAVWIARRKRPAR